ncbi:hypothetical protein SCLCIDRAFT_21194 [Scleroderma citrinum Foug A]|uniref:Uncharacterized protein n=1 Tax=Scleroderma citrinum Foug A TaxID=1036808 RepID=A0A0C3EGB0_9AGAM|nr:hypothetical protein SCLCIDRAFT_21194 [Scleroderma citrinum Foug A]
MGHRKAEEAHKEGGNVAVQEAVNNYQLHWMLPSAVPGNAYPSLLGNAHPSLLGKYSPSAFSHTDPCLMAGVCGQAIGPPQWPSAIRVRPLALHCGL